MATLYVPQPILDLKDSDAIDFLRLYLDWERKQKLSSSITVFAVFVNPRPHSEPWIYPGLTQQHLLASGVLLSTLFSQEEKEIQKLVYSIGFTLMLGGSLIFLIHIMRG